MSWTLESPEGARPRVKAWNRRPTPALPVDAWLRVLRDFRRAAPNGFTRG